MPADETGLPDISLIGHPRGRERLTTPALLVELDALESNLAIVADLCRRTGVALRPHVKGHKCVELARRQLASGAIGLSCTTLAEAELMATAGAQSLLVTSPIPAQRQARRLAALGARVPELIVVADHPDGLGPLAAASRAGKPIQVLVDLDVGQRRTGVPGADSARALALARAVFATPGLVFAGLQAYYGHLQAIMDHDERAARARAQQALISTCVDQLQANGLPPRIVSGGGTGTLMVDSDGAPFTELQPGSYPFLDVQYSRQRLTLDGAPMLRPSLFVRGHVISTGQPDRVTVNVGMKATATDAGAPVLVWPSDMEAEYVFAGDEHGVLVVPPGARTPALGEAVELMPSHCDTTVNLHAAIHAVRDQVLEAVWSIGARGIW